MNWFNLIVGIAALFAATILAGCRYNLGKGGPMSIWEAVEHEDLAAIEAYVCNGGDLEVGSTRLGKTPLLHALILKKKNSYSKLLSLGANPNTLCRGGGAIAPANSSVVHHAALEEDPFWLQAALESGGDPNQMNEAKGMSKGRPLYSAIWGKGGVANVRLLCEHGADINAPVDHLGLTALYQAASGAKFEITYYLLERGADVSEPRSVHERNTFIFSIRQKKPEFYGMNPHAHKWCAAVWDWLRSHGKDPEKATWNGAKWTWDDRR